MINGLNEARESAKMVAISGAHFGLLVSPGPDNAEPCFLMAGDSTDKIDSERLRILHAFWLSLFGLGLAAALTVFLVAYQGTKVNSSAEVVAIVGLFTSVTGTLVGAFFGLQIGAVGAEHERRSREAAEESRQKAEEVTRTALAHLDPDKAKEVLNASQEAPVS
jgi:hypothetical protein